VYRQARGLPACMCAHSTTMNEQTNERTRNTNHKRGGERAPEQFGFGGQGIPPPASAVGRGWGGASQACEGGGAWGKKTGPNTGRRGVLGGLGGSVCVGKQSDGQANKGGGARRRGWACALARTHAHAQSAHTPPRRRQVFAVRGGFALFCDLPVGRQERGACTSCVRARALVFRPGEAARG
jgi:hypothetical protein